MGKKALVRLATVVFMTVVFVSSAFAEHLFGPDELDTSFGAYFRLRQEIWDNNFTLDTLNTPPAPLGTTANRNFFRLKSSVWGKLDYDKTAALFLKLTNEMKYYLPVSEFREPTGSTSRYVEDELIFDNLYAEFNLKKPLNIPVSLKLGRQDFIMTHGEGFLIMDGTPGDGSRSFYFDAFKANIQFNENNNLDLIYITNQETDTYLPVMYTPPGKRLLNSSDEQGVVVYSRNKLSKNVAIEPYYMWKQEEAFGTTPELDLHTLGIRGTANVDGWKFEGEFAYQFGEYDGGRDRTGYGGYITAGRKYENVTLKPEWSLGFIYLSGDDPDSTDEDEGFNPLFSRWPKWSELFVFTLVPETTRYTRTPAYWTNLLIYRANVRLNFTPQASLWLWYNYLQAAEETRITAGPFAGMFSNNSKDRGHLPQVQFNYKFTKNIDGYLLWEYFMPGDFYANGKKDANFFRWQIQVKI